MYVKTLWTWVDADGSDSVTWDEFEAFFRENFEGDERDFYLRNEHAMKLAGGNDRIITADEWTEWYTCQDGQPKSYWAYLWLEDAENYGGEGHVTMPDDHIAARWAEHGADYDHTLSVLNSIQGKNTRDSETGELFFWAVYENEQL
jgi:hypothetical protein